VLIFLSTTERQDGSAPATATEEADLFDVALDDTVSKPDSRRDQRREKGGANKRQKKNEKFGFGGKKRFSKSGDAISSGDLTGFSARKMKGKTGGGGAAKRPGKSRRAGARR
jgi:rRNA-processing protein EBP2